MADLSHLSVIFDLDGTLIDSVPQIHATTNRILGDIGLGPTDRATVQSFVGNGLPTLIDRLLAFHAAPLAADARAGLIARFEADYSANHDLTSLYPKARWALQHLKDQEAALGLCTNKPIGPTRALVDHFGLAPFFTAILGGDSLPVRKPDPEQLRATARHLGPTRVIFVGDSEVDAETAHAAGVPFILYTEGYRKSRLDQIPHHAAFSDWGDLPGLVQALA